jgi:hypothetical protein
MDENRTPGRVSEPSSERRRQPRFAVDVAMRLTAGGASFPGFVCDICRDAAWVESEHSLALDEQVAVAMELPGTGGPMMIEGRVVRVGPGEKATHGAAVLFKELPPMVATRIDFFVALQG